MMFYYYYKYTTGKKKRFGVCYSKHNEWNNVRIITYNRGGACVVRDRDDRNMLLFVKVGWCLKKKDRNVFI